MAEVVPFRVRMDIAPGSVPLTPSRLEEPVGREAILSVLGSECERMLVLAIVASLERLAVTPLVPVERLECARPLLAAFRDATGVDFVGCQWDEGDDDGE